MRNFFQLALITLALLGVCSAQSSSVTSSKSAAGRAADKKQAASRIPGDQFKQLQDAFSAFQQKTEQQQQETEQKLKSLQQENANLAEQLKQYQQKAESAQTIAAHTAAEAGAAEAQKTAVTKLQSEVAAVKVAVTATANAVQKSDKRLNELESPSAIHYKGVKLTPGGYLQFAQIYRTHNANSDTSDSYGSFPLSGSADSKVGEFRISGRASRFSLKAEGDTRKIKMLGYLEVDFLGSTPTSTETQTNSFPPRLRLAFGEMKFGHGWSIAGGQNWSMLQTTRHGFDPLSEWVPILIDNSYTPGFSYARQGSFRITKELVSNRQWLGFSVENPETVANVQCLEIYTDTSLPRYTCTSSILGGVIQGAENTSLVSSPSNGFSTATSSSTLLSSPSNDIAPDLVLKYAIEQGWGHFEVKAIGRVFHDRVYPQYLNGSSIAGVNNHTTEGGGVGIGAIMPLIPNKVDAVVQALAGKGIGRFGSTSGPDVTLNTKGDLVPIKALQAVVGVETHPTPKFDFNFYAGDEYYGRTVYAGNSGMFGSTDSATFVIGYGAPQFIDNSCTESTSTLTSTKTAPYLCMSSSQNRNVWAAQPSMWYRMFKGSQGTVQLGASYAYIYRRTWDGVASANNSSGLTSYRPLAIENIIMTSFRYYLP